MTRILILIVLLALCSGGRAAEPSGPPPLLLIFDASGSTNALSQTLLRVTVLEADKNPAKLPAIHIRTAGKPWETPRTMMENPSVFALEPGEYDVTVRVGTGEETAPKRVTVEENKTAEVTVSTGTGTLELTLTAGGKAMPSVPMVKLMSGLKTIAAVSESPARFQAQEGTYSVRLEFPNGQMHEIPGLNVVAGETTRQTAEVPCGQLTVKVSGGERYPFVEIQQDGKLVAALSDNPARFLLLSGKYAVYVRHGERLSEQVPVTLEAGEDEVVELTASP